MYIPDKKVGATTTVNPGSESKKPVAVRNTTYYYRLDEMRACGKKEFVVCQVRGGNYVL